ncbi:MAG: carbohydrate-binding protein, partial [Chitinispirillaceae bacterium]|nr:carbohydrate-binding protein [Chitinispirillaceae bacterium]
YPSHDSSEYVTTWLMNDFKAYSSSDLVQWTDHGVILAETNVTWDINNHTCWAPDMHYYNGYYYFYFCMNSRVGVARSASPSGTFTDWLGSYLVTNIDPCCYSEDNGNKYFTWGQPGGVGYGTNCFGHARLNTDMRSFVSSPVGLCMPAATNMTEAAFIFKRNGLYYCLYGTTSNGVIRYGTSSTLDGPYTFRGGVISGYKYCQGTGHGSVFELNGQWYICSHMCIYGNAYFRKSGLWYLHFRDNGYIDSIAAPGTWGVGRYKAFDTLQAENYFNMKGILQQQCSEGGHAVFGIHDGDWIVFPKTNFLNCQSGLNVHARVASTRGGTIEIRKGDTAGTLLAACAVPNTGSMTTWQTVTSALAQAPGNYESDLYFMFRGTAGDTNQQFACNWFRFTTTSTIPRNAFDEIQAEAFDSQATVSTSTAGVIAGSGSVRAIENGDCLKFNSVFFGNGAGAVDIRYRSASSAATRTIEFRADSRTGTVIGTVAITDNTNVWRAILRPMSPAVTGLHSLYVNFIGTGGAVNLFEIDMIRFVESVPSVGVAGHSARMSINPHGGIVQRVVAYTTAGGGNAISTMRGNTFCTGVYSLSGKKVEAPIRDKGRIVDLSKLPVGVYLLKTTRK